jgi:oxalyl-CoA decarboxylase
VRHDTCATIRLVETARLSNPDPPHKLATDQSILPVCIVVFNNNGIYRGTDVNPTGGPDAATTVFVKGARYDRMMEAFGGVGVHVTTPDELSRAVNEAMDSGRPTLVNAAIDPAAGSESGNIDSLNPQSGVRKKPTQ